jgi:L-lactate dehydrogenase complex protein LldG
VAGRLSLCLRRHFARVGRETLVTKYQPSRERILERIRAGLRTPAPPLKPASPDSIIFEPVTDPLDRFQQECKANLIECLLTPHSRSSAEQLATVMESLPAGEIFVQDAPVLRGLIEHVAPRRVVRWSSDGGPSEQSQATLTLAETLIAQTGSVFVTSSCGGRGASVVAPCHIVFATLSQLVPDLQTALSNAFEKRTLEQNSFGCVISGSSRTADIEKILVQGAHGPRRLVVILQTDT